MPALDCARTHLHLCRRRTTQSTPVCSLPPWLEHSGIGGYQHLGKQAQSPSLRSIRALAPYPKDRKRQKLLLAFLNVSQDYSKVSASRKATPRWSLAETVGAPSSSQLIFRSGSFQAR